MAFPTTQLCQPPCLDHDQHHLPFALALQQLKVHGLLQALELLGSRSALYLDLHFEMSVEVGWMRRPVRKEDAVHHEVAILLAARGAVVASISILTSCKPADKRDAKCSEWPSSQVSLFFPLALARSSPVRRRRTYPHDARVVPKRALIVASAHSHTKPPWICRCSSARRVLKESLEDLPPEPCCLGRSLHWYGPLSLCSYSHDLQ